MTVKYAGVGFLPPPDQNSRVYQYWHGHRVEEFDDPGFNVRWMNHLPVPPIPKREPPRIGALRWPAGASDWATCHLVASGDELAAVRTALGASPAAADLELSDETRTVTASMWMLPPRPIAQRGVKEYYLLTLVDDRWWWWQTGNESLLGPQADTWVDLLTNLFAAVGESPTLPTIPAGYDVPTQIRWDVGFKPIPVLIDAACALVGFRVVRQLDGTVEVQTAADANSADDAAWTEFQNFVLAGGRIAVADLVRSIPASVTTVFWGTDPASADTTLASLSLPDYAGLTAAAGKYAQVVADMPAQAASAKRAAYAAQAATDYYGWALSRSDYTLRGIRDRVINDNQQFQEWVARPDQIVTRVVRNVFSSQNVYGDKPPTIRFPANLTSTYNASTGYSWERLTLVTTAADYATADPPKTGDYAFEITGDQTLPANTPVLLYSNPDGSGWEFQNPGRYETRCVSGDLVRQVSFDGGVTWTTVESLGTPCTGGGSGSGSGGGSGNVIGTSIGPGWVRGLIKENCLKMTVLGANGRCAQIDTSQVIHLYSTDGETWSTTHLFNFEGGSGAVVFTLDGAVPTLTIGGHNLTWDAAGVSGGTHYIDFAGGGPLCLDAGSPVVADCGDNTFVVRIVCEICLLYWYCVAESGDCSTGVILPLELTEAEADGLGSLVCSGPYDTEAEALAVCPCDCSCAVSGFNTQFTFTVAGVTGPGGDGCCIDCTGDDSCPSLNGTWTLKYRGNCVWATDEDSVCYSPEKIYTLGCGVDSSGNVVWSVSTPCAVGASADAWTCPDANFDPATGGVFTLTTPVSCCDPLPATITLVAVGTFIQC